PDRQQVEHEQDPLEREVPEPNDARYEFIDQRGLGLCVEKGVVVWEEAWIQILEDCGKIDGLIFDPEMIAVDSDGQCGKQSQSGRHGVARKVIALLLG